MARGGAHPRMEKKRPGTGGKRDGGAKGNRIRITADREADIDGSGLTPLDYMLDVLRDDDADRKDRKWAAEKAAPFCHPKLANIDFQGNVTMKTHEEWVAELDDDE